MAQPNNNMTPAWAKLRKSFDSYFKPQGKPTFTMGMSTHAKTRKLVGAYSPPNKTLQQPSVAGGRVPVGGSYDRAPSGPLRSVRPAAAQQIVNSRGPALSPTNDARQNALLRRLRRTP